MKHMTPNPNRKEGTMKQIIFHLESYQGNDTSLTVDMGQPDTDRMFFIMELGDDDKVTDIDCGYRSYEEAYDSALGRGADPLPPKPKKEPEESITVGNHPASLRRAIEAFDVLGNLGVLPPPVRHRRGDRALVEMVQQARQR
jgi:hypothetical protein